MAFGLGALKLRPAAFWSMTLREMAAVMRAALPGEGGMHRVALRDLMHRYPDK